jgi:hypothetical protein
MCVWVYTFVTRYSFFKLLMQETKTIQNNTFHSMLKKVIERTLETEVNGSTSWPVLKDADKTWWMLTTCRIVCGHLISTQSAVPQLPVSQYFHHIAASYNSNPILLSCKLKVNLESLHLLEQNWGAPSRCHYIPLCLLVSHSSETRRPRIAFRDSIAVVNSRA